MVYRKLGKSGVEASAIGLGTWAVGGGEWWGDSDEESSIKTIGQAIDAGITLIDTAPGYGFGLSETVAGKGIKGKRDKVVLSTKCGLWWHDDRGSDFFELEGRKVKRCLDPDTIQKELELSLERLQTDHIDVYFTHWQSVSPYLTPIEKTMGRLMDLKRQGLIKAIGASNVSRDDISEYLKFGELDVIQEKYSMLDRGIEETLLPVCNQNQLSVMAYSPLEQGLLTGRIGMDYTPDPKQARAGIPWMAPEKRKLVLDMLSGWDDLLKKYNCTLAQLVITWTMNRPSISHVLCGARKPHHIKETVAAADIAISSADMGRITADILNLGTTE